MRYEDFRWAGKLASEMGVVVTEQVEYTRPEERVEQITVPGRSGTLTVPGTDSWETVTYAPVCALRPDADWEAVAAWLQGRGEVVFGSMPDYGFDARLINQIDFQTIFQAQKSYKTFAPVFACQPLRHLAVQEQEILCSNGMLLHNPGNVAARPQIFVWCNEEFTLTIAGQAFTVTGLTNIGGIIVDCDAQDCINMIFSGLLNDHMDGDFPTIPPGDSYISWTAPEGSQVTKVSLKPRWRWL